MRIILEKKDLLSLLGKALGYPLEDDDVEVTADPFEVRISSVRLGELAHTDAPPVSTISPPTPVEVMTGYPDDDDPSMDGLIHQNERMQEQGGDAPMVREHLGMAESYTAPPPGVERNSR